MTSPQHYETLFQRHEQNPILTAADWPYAVQRVCILLLSRRLSEFGKPRLVLAGTTRVLVRSQTRSACRRPSSRHPGDRSCCITGVRRQGPAVCYPARSVSRCFDLETAHHCLLRSGSSIFVPTAYEREGDVGYVATSHPAAPTLGDGATTTELRAPGPEAVDRLCNGEQRRPGITLYDHYMTLEYTKASFAAVWVLAICAIGLAGEVTFAGRMVLTAVAVLPPLAMWRLWTAPRQSMSESIREAIR